MKIKKDNYKKKKRGAPRKPPEEKSTARNYAYRPDIAKFLDHLDAPGAFIQKLIRESPEFKKFNKDMVTT